MNIKKIIELYKHVCNNYFYIGFILIGLIWITTYIIQIKFKTFLIFELLDFSVLNTIEFFILNLIVISISHWIINKKLKKNWICIIWILPLIIQMFNLIKVILS